MFEISWLRKIEKSDQAFGWGEKFIPKCVVSNKLTVEKMYNRAACPRGRGSMILAMSSTCEAQLFLSGRTRMFWLTNAYTVMSSWMRRPCSGMAMYTVWLELQQAWLSLESSAIGVLIGSSFRRVLPMDRLTLSWECAQMTLPDCPKVERVVGGAKCRNDNVRTCMKQRAALSNSRDNWSLCTRLVTLWGLILQQKIPNFRSLNEQPSV